MAVKQHRAREEISLSSEEEDESNTGDDTDPDKADPDQTNNKYPIKLQEGIYWKL